MDRTRILIVDDEPPILQLLNDVLDLEGYIAETVDNAIDALDMMKTRNYNLILMDIKLPGMTGIELFEKMSEIDFSIAEKVVFITGDVTSLDTNEFLHRNKLNYITKPFSTGKLVGEIKRILASIPQENVD